MIKEELMDLLDKMLSSCEIGGIAEQNAYVRAINDVKTEISDLFSDYKRIDRFLNLMQKRAIAHPTERKGQRAMNILSYIDKPLYDKITMTEADCFYDDEKYSLLTGILLEEWSRECTMSN